MVYVTVAVSAYTAGKLGFCKYVQFLLIVLLVADTVNTQQTPKLGAMRSHRHASTVTML